MVRSRKSWEINHGGERSIQHIPGNVDGEAGDECHSDFMSTYDSVEMMTPYGGGTGISSKRMKTSFAFWSGQLAMGQISSRLPGGWRGEKCFGCIPVPKSGRAAGEVHNAVRSFAMHVKADRDCGFDFYWLPA